MSAATSANLGPPAKLRNSIGRQPETTGGEQAAMAAMAAAAAAASQRLKAPIKLELKLEQQQKAISSQAASNSKSSKTTISGEKQQFTFSATSRTTASNSQAQQLTNGPSSNGLNQQQQQQNTNQTISAPPGSVGAAQSAPATPARKRGRRRQQSIPDQPNGLDRVFVWDIEGSLVHADLLIATTTATTTTTTVSNNLQRSSGCSSSSSSSLVGSKRSSEQLGAASQLIQANPGVAEKVSQLALKLKEIAMTFCDDHFFLHEFESSDQVHIDDVPTGEVNQSEQVSNQSNNNQIHQSQQQSHQQQHQQLQDPANFANQKHHVIDHQDVSQQLIQQQHGNNQNHRDQQQQQHHYQHQPQQFYSTGYASLNVTSSSNSVSNCSASSGSSNSCQQMLSEQSISERDKLIVVGPEIDLDVNNNLNQLDSPYARGGIDVESRHDSSSYLFATNDHNQVSTNSELAGGHMPDQLLSQSGERNNHQQQSFYAHEQTLASLSSHQQVQLPNVSSTYDPYSSLTSQQSRSNGPTDHQSVDLVELDQPNSHHFRHSHSQQLIESDANGQHQSSYLDGEPEDHNKEGSSGRALASSIYSTEGNVAFQSFPFSGLMDDRHEATSGSYSSSQQMSIGLDERNLAAPYLFDNLHGPESGSTSYYHQPLGFQSLDQHQQNQSQHNHIQQTQHHQSSSSGSQIHQQHQRHQPLSLNNQSQVHSLTYQQHSHPQQPHLSSSNHHLHPHLHHNHHQPFHQQELTPMTSTGGQLDAYSLYTSSIQQASAAQEDEHHYLQSHQSMVEGYQGPEMQVWQTLEGSQQQQQQQPPPHQSHYASHQEQQFESSHHAAQHNHSHHNHFGQHLQPTYSHYSPHQTQQHFHQPSHQHYQSYTHPQHHQQVQAYNQQSTDLQHQHQDQQSSQVLRLDGQIQPDTIVPDASHPILHQLQQPSPVSSRNRTSLGELLPASSKQTDMTGQQPGVTLGAPGSNTLRTVLNNHHKQVTQRLSMRFHRIKTVYHQHRQSLMQAAATSSSASRPNQMVSGIATAIRGNSNSSSNSNGPDSALKIPASSNFTGQNQLVVDPNEQNRPQLDAQLAELLAELDHYTLDWRKRALDCLKLIEESPNCTNIIITKLPLVVAFAHLICLGLSQYFDVDQVYSANKSSKEACIKRVKKRFGATNRCSYIIIGGQEEIEMAKRLDLPSWKTSPSSGHRQLLQLFTALEAGYLM